jgi:hypothetical protein
MIDSNDIQQPGMPSGDDQKDPTLRPKDPTGPAAEDAPVGLRIGRNPANLGGEVADEGDVTYPNPEPADVQI